MFLSAETTAGQQIAFAAANAVCLPFPDETFDAVSSNEIVEHLLDVSAVLDEMARVTRVGGVIVLRSPALSSPIWPLWDLPKLFRNKGGRPPFYTNLRQASAFFVANMARTFRIAIQRNPVFEQRQPNLSVPGADYDAVYWSSAIEVARYFGERGLKILAHAG